jgi:ATP-dependent RNA helicase RhlE
MFSATMPEEIRELAKQWLRRPHEVKVTPVASTPERVSQSVCFVERQQKPVTLKRFLHETRPSRTLVFARTKRGADKVARGLERNGIRAIAIHGNKSQSRRQAAIREFNSERPPVLVATDLASRGLDFSDVSHVINYDMPDTPEAYVHRIGRTARAGASGRAVSFCERADRQCLRMIEKLTKQTVSVEQLPGTTAKRTSGVTATDNNGRPENNDTVNPVTSTESPAKNTGRKPRRRTSRNHPHAATTTSNRHSRRKPRQRRKSNAKTV